MRDDVVPFRSRRRLPHIATEYLDTRHDHASAADLCRQLKPKYQAQVLTVPKKEH